MKRLINISLIFLVSILAIVVLSGLMNIGVLTYDDLTNKLFAINGNNDLITVAQSFARGQGRFFFYVSGLMLFFPYLVDNLLYTKILSFLPILINIILFGILTYKVFGSKKLSWVVALFFFGFIQNSWEHNLLVSYPFAFTTSFAFTLGGMLLMLKSFEKKHFVWDVLSALSFFISLLTYETFLVYFILYFGLSLYRSYKSGNKYTRLEIILNSLKKIKFHIAALIIYFSLYYFFKQKFPGGYDGNQIGNISLLGYLKTVFQLGSSSFPGYIYFSKLYSGFISSQSYSYTGDKRHPLFIIQNLQLIWIVKALIMSFAFYLTTLIKEEKYSKVKFLIILFVSVILIFLPQLIISITNKYQSWALSGSIIGFTTTYFSYFGSILLVSVIITAAIGIFGNKYIRALLTLAAISYIFIFSIVTDYSNYHVTQSQRQTTLMWEIMTPFTESKSQQIPNNSIVYAPNLNTFFTYPGYWDKIFEIKTGKKVRFITGSELFKNEYLKNPETFEKNFYYLGYFQEDKDPNAYMVVSEVKSIEDDGGIIRIYSDKVNVITYSKYRKFLLQFKTINGFDFYEKAKVDGREIITLDGHFTFLVNKEYPGEKLMKTEISANKIDLQSILISYFNNFNSAIK